MFDLLMYTSRKHDPVSLAEVEAASESDLTGFDEVNLLEGLTIGMPTESKWLESWHDY